MLPFSTKERKQGKKRLFDPEHTDIDLLNGLGNGDTFLGNSLLEGVQVAGNNVDLLDGLGGQIGLIRGDITGQDTTMDSRVKGLDTSAQDLGGLGDRRDIPVDFGFEVNNREAFGSVFFFFFLFSISRENFLPPLNNIEDQREVLQYR